MAVISGLVGGLILEVGDMTWVGTSLLLYQFLVSIVIVGTHTTLLSRLVGLSNYLVVCLVCMVLVKRAAGILARLQVCL